MAEQVRAEITRLIDFLRTIIAESRERIAYLKYNIDHAEPSTSHGWVIIHNSQKREYYRRSTLVSLSYFSIDCVIKLTERGIKIIPPDESDAVALANLCSHLRNLMQEIYNAYHSMPSEYVNWDQIIVKVEHEIYYIQERIPAIDHEIQDSVRYRKQR